LFVELLHQLSLIRAILLNFLCLGALNQPDHYFPRKEQVIKPEKDGLRCRPRRQRIHLKINPIKQDRLKVEHSLFFGVQTEPAVELLLCDFVFFHFER
jgi:hypothetical protein